MKIKTFKIRLPVIKLNKKQGADTKKIQEPGFPRVMDRARGQSQGGTLLFLGLGDTGDHLGDLDDILVLRPSGGFMVFVLL